ncbi:triacylglycerol lipase 2-like [Pistacia vera]|uniref:triacylglycerol lipase 2-like n=1 Tax=Pistacia vera TaxID=55513 RepID=UPI001262BB11|nr:triacylglycerol lipase 2-like [Pistacia vera]
MAKFCGLSLQASAPSCGGSSVKVRVGPRMAVGLIGIAEFNPKGDPAVDSFLRSICSFTGLNCNDLVTSLSGFNCCLNAPAINNYPENEPQSTLTKNLIHLSQSESVIAKFDGFLPYNLRRYEAFRPPVYNVANLPSDLPLFLSYGGNDAISDVEDVQYLINIQKYHLGDKLKSLFVKDYGHFDFIKAVNAKDLVYNEVVDFFKS